MPLLEVVRADDPEAILGKSGDGEVAHEGALGMQHRGEPHAADGGNAAREESVEPRGRVWAGDLVARIDARFVGADIGSDGGHLARDMGKGVVALQRWHMLEVEGREELRHLEPPGCPELGASGLEILVRGCRVQWPASRQVLVGIGREEASSIELIGRGEQVVV